MTTIMPVLRVMARIRSGVSQQVFRKVGGRARNEPPGGADQGLGAVVQAGAMADTEPLQRLADGTVKQRNPFTGTRVWTMPGRGRRPVPKAVERPVPLDGARDGLESCAFCPGHAFDTPPEKARLVREEGSAAEPVWRRLDELPAGRLDATRADFRLVPNLFEICSLDYWRCNHGVEVPGAARRRAEAYLADPAGHEHLRRVWSLRERASGNAEPDGPRLAEAALGWMASGHQLVIPRRHHVPGATMSDQLASAGELTVAEHRTYVRLSIEAMAGLYADNPAARYVSVFQNWLRPAGASFEHLHRQLVAIDEVGEHVEAAARQLELDPAAFNHLALDVAVRERLLVAANEHAVAFAGFGHRYPSIEVFSLSQRREPWLLGDTERDAMSDLVHAVHAANGAQVPANEEWHHRPPGMDEAMPWRVVIKRRTSTLAGFEGDTKIYLTTQSPWDVREQAVEALQRLRRQGRIADMQLGDECTVPPGSIPF